MRGASDGRDVGHTEKEPSGDQTDESPLVVDLDSGISLKELTSPSQEPLEEDNGWICRKQSRRPRAGVCCWVRSDPREQEGGAGSEARKAGLRYNRPPLGAAEGMLFPRGISNRGG